ncbi:MAG TPA: hypothetical protein VKA60_10340 [Blastocatellia bacterium]|nr:hypothetical protein [Blastocatellia bacterium]
MTNEEMERAIAFLLNHHAQLSADLSQLTANVEAMRKETRYGFEKLIEANEVTRRLAEEVAQLAVQTSQRVTGLEHHVSDLESNQ